VSRACTHEVAWESIVRMRDLAHHYHRRDLTVVRATVDDHLGPLSIAVDALLAQLNGAADEV